MKKVSHVAFQSSIQAPSYTGVNGEISLNIAKKTDLEMVFDGNVLIVRCYNVSTNIIGEILIPLGNIKSMVIIPE